MPLTELTKITSPGIKTDTNWVGNNAHFTGITTTDDVVWWMREKVLELGLDTWFHPSVDVQRMDDSDLYAFDLSLIHI